MAHSREWSTYEGKPAGGDFISAGDDEIRNTKVDIRERMLLNHVWNGNTAIDGRHIVVHLTATANPTHADGWCIISGSAAAAGNTDLVVTPSSTPVQVTCSSYINLDAARLNNESYLLSSSSDDSANINIVRVNTRNQIHFPSVPYCTVTTINDNYQLLVRGGAAQVLVDTTTLTTNSGAVAVNIRVNDSGIGSLNMAAGACLHYLGTVVYSGNAPTSWTTKDLSGEVGANRAFVTLALTHSGASTIQDFYLRTVGHVRDIGYASGSNSYMGAGMGAASVGIGKMAYLSVVTDDSGYIQWNAYKGEACTMELQTFLL